MHYTSLLSVAAAWLLTTVTAQSCPTLTNDAEASTASDYSVQLSLISLRGPRSILFDTEGHLLVLDRGTGVIQYSVDETCLTVNTNSRNVVVDDPQLNHGLALSTSGTILYASTSNEVYQYTYNPSTGAISNRKTLITGMYHSGHSTRTLLLSQSVPDLLLVSRGSGPNLDDLAIDVRSGRSQIRAFNLTELNSADTAADYSTTGRLIGWGLRNSVGMAEDSVGQLWSVENSADNLERENRDIHQDNPGEELNYHGYLNDTTGTSVDTGPNHGYPSCFAVWQSDDFPDTDLVTGMQFALTPNETFTDETCANEYRAPRLTFQAHMAPLDIKFDAVGDAWVTFHGSWNRDDPAGYKISRIPFTNSSPSAPQNSTTGTIDIYSQGTRLRPVGLAFDSNGNLFFSSDDTGEIYVIRQSNGAAIGPTTNTTTTGDTATETSGTGSGETPTETMSDGAAETTAGGDNGVGRLTTGGGMVLGTVFVVVLVQFVI